jgi:hypothetical protein
VLTRSDSRKPPNPGETSTRTGGEISVRSAAGEVVALLRKDSKLKTWVFEGREGSKHKGKTLVEVANTDPSYLTFLWSNSLKYLSDAAIDALDDIMEDFQIPRELPKRKKR